MTGFRVQGLGFRVQDLGLRFTLNPKPQDLGSRDSLQIVWGSKSLRRPPEMLGGEGCMWEADSFLPCFWGFKRLSVSLELEPLDLDVDVFG